MQLILESESAVDLKTKMSLSEDSVEKDVSDILTGVQNGGISNGDVTAESNQAAKVIENDLEKFDQIKNPLPTDTNDVVDHNGDATISETANIDASNESNATDIINGNNLCDMNSPGNSEAVTDLRSEDENISIEENRTECNESSNKSVADCDSSANDLNKYASESEVNAREPLETVCDNVATEPLETVCDNAATETTNIESSRDVDVSENTNSCEIGVIKQVISDSTEDDPKESSNNIDSNMNLNANVDIKQEDDATAVSDHMTTAIPEDCNLKKEIEEIISEDNDLESNPISLLTSDETAMADTDNDNVKSEIMTAISDDMTTAIPEDSTLKKETDEIITQENDLESNQISLLTSDEPALAQTNSGSVKSKITTGVSDDMTTAIPEDSTLKKETEEIISEENDLESNPISLQTSDKPALAETNNGNVKSEITTAVSDDMTAMPEDSTLKKETKEIISEENDLEPNPISLQTSDEPAHDSNVKSEMMKTETAENAEDQETMETDNTEIDTNDENVDMIRLDANITNNDKVNNFVVNEVENTELNAITVDANEKESVKTDDVISMDVDENTTASEKDKNQTVSKAPANITEIMESDAETVLPMENNVLELDTKTSDDLIVNLDDDKEKSKEPVSRETESTFTKADDDKPALNQDDDNLNKKVEKTPTEDPMSVDEIIDLDEPKEAQNSNSSDKIKSNKDNSIKTVSEGTKPIAPVLKLSNTLDILSDDEEEEAPKPSDSDTTDSKCINIEDDDDIMLIDDETSGTESKADPIKEQEIEKQIESKPAGPTKNVNAPEDSKSIDKVEDDVEKDAPVPDQEVTVSTSAPDIGGKTEENKLENEIKKPLIPENFLKTCKKNLVDMTRDELEEFCILKVVESILDRSNLSEIKNKLKTLTQNLEEYKKKAMMLQKQNRDLQVVFKSVQEDVKKANDAPIVPLKITRSVGMQVLMSDKPDKRRRAGIGIPNTLVNNNNNRPLRNPVAQGPRPQKPPTQPIPVPRLVPANTPTKPPQQVSTSKVTSPLPNGVKTISPVQKGEKRTHNRIQSVTVDLTDDEPPTKIVNRTGPMPPVRLVPSQNLLAAPRTPGVNSPRKVYIPISGPQGQPVRPGQTIMLKTVPTPGTRPRAPGPMVRMPQSIRMTRPQGLRHPAPLPECMKQYQPPNWKALPPAPDLKLAKVENGIVISWKIEGYQEDSYEEIASYQLYAYQETTAPPNTTLWKKIGDVKALPLPMACTLTQFMAGYKYYFAVRAVDIRSRLGPFSLPGSILLLNKM